LGAPGAHHPHQSRRGYFQLCGQQPVGIDAASRSADLAALTTLTPLPIEDVRSFSPTQFHRLEGELEASDNSAAARYRMASANIHYMAAKQYLNITAGDACLHGHDKPALDAIGSVHAVQRTRCFCDAER
jgi:hypothetical protein